MSSACRSVSWCIRVVRMKLLNTPRQACKLCIRCLSQAWESEWTRVYLVIAAFCTLMVLLVGWLIYRDPCFQWEIRTQMCEDYHNGLIAGALCFDICVEQVGYLSHCVEQHDDLSIFRWDDLLLKARRGDHKVVNDLDQYIWEGMTMADLEAVLDSFFGNILGRGDHSRLIEDVVDYADFNKDKQVNFGEIRSMWHLLQIQEFQTLFIFRDNPVFPSINGTCGSLYFVEDTFHHYLYRRNKSSYVDKIFPNRYRWGAPAFLQRAYIGLGILEYTFSIREQDNARFYMCDFSPSNFGYSRFYEMKVSNVGGLISEAMLNKTFESKYCDSDIDCVYGTVCRTSCDKLTQKCRSLPENYIPDIVKVCNILQDYLLFNMPTKIKYVLSHLVADCIRIGKKAVAMNPYRTAVEENMALDRLNQVLWDELKFSENKWMDKTTKKPALIV
ncbi:divergent protein kinase domain 1A-like isoform X2 [Mya arenaria]|nr:divergent protein kinase domain 1A-like isoform X2 [Mya arenaria]XP_052790171.1 divergent protein kinase domain 1A-like isoform X2 [Mya arenaria]